MLLYQHLDQVGTAQILRLGQRIELLQHLGFHLQLDPAQAVGLVAPELIALVDFQLRGAGQGIGLGPARPFLFGEEIQGGSVFLLFCHCYIYTARNLIQHLKMGTFTCLSP